MYMKRIVWVWSLLVGLYPLTLIGQSITDDFITYDFKEHKLKIPEKNILKEGVELPVQINKINRFLYNVTVTYNHTEFNVQPPELLTKLLGVPVQSVTSTPSGQLTAASEDAEKSKDPIKDFFKEYEKLSEQLDRNVLLEVQLHDPTYIPADSVLSRSQNDKYTLYEESIKRIQRLNALYTRIVKLTGTGPDSPEIAEVKRIKKAMDEGNYEKQLRDGLLLELSVVKENFQYTSPPIELVADLMNFTIQITPRSKEDFSTPLPSETRSFSIHVRRIKPHITFSTGLFGAQLKDDNYVVQPVLATDTVQSYRLQKEQEGKWGLGIHALAHLSWQVAPAISWGFNAGAGIDNTSSVRYMLGGSVLFGVKNRIAVNGGLVLGEVKKLSDSIEAFRTYPNTYKPELSYKKCLQTGGYVSLTYNFN